MLYLNVGLNTILSTDIYVALGTMSAESIRVYPINSGPAERVQSMTCRLLGNYPATEYHH